MATDGKDILKIALRKGRLILTSAFLLSIVYNVIRLSGPMFMMLIYDRVLPSRSTETLVVLFSMVVVLLIAMGLFEYARKRLLVRFAAQFQETVEDHIFSSTSKDKFFKRGNNKPVAGLDEVDQVRGFINGSSVAILDFLWAPMFLAVVFILHPILGWVATAGVGVLLLLTAIKALVTRVRDEQARQASNKINVLKNLMTSSRELLRSQEMTSAFNNRWVTARRNSRDMAIESNDVSAWFTIFVRQTRMIVQYSVLATGAYLTLQGKLTPGAMVAATFLVVRVIIPVESFLLQIPNIVKTRESWAKLKKILETADKYSPPEIDNGFRPDLKLTGVSARSPLTKEMVLRNVSFTATPGSIIEINGDSGSGKTALCEVILGIWPRSAGKILCGGQNVDRFDSDQASHIFGYMPEKVEFLNGTIAENIAHLDEEIDRERMHEVAKLALIHNTIMGLPDGYDTEVGQLTTCLSAGQQSRIAFARALYHRPKILVLDEPDPLLRGALAKRLQPMLEEFKKDGGILIFVARKPLGIANTDKVMTLENGSLKVVNLDNKIKSISQKTATTGKVAAIKKG